MSPPVDDAVRPTSVSPCGNYAVQILWEDGFNQVRRTHGMHVIFVLP